jgi:hypothetical protein
VNNKQYLTRCGKCGCATSKKYAREHQNQCKGCAEPDAPRVDRGPKCSQCGAPISWFKKRHGYVCEGCYAQNDPVGAANERRGLYDGGDC